MKIELRHLGKEIKGTPILQDISLTFESGHIYGFKGKNGSGKTMLMRLICGFIFPTSGQIIFDGIPFGKGQSLPFRIGALIENPAFLPEYSGFKNLNLLASLQTEISSADIENVILSVGLDPTDQRKYKKYSLGMKQRLGIAAALLGAPEIVILDEPMNALDEKGISTIGAIISSLKSKGALVLLSNHDSQNLNQFSDEVIELVDGKVTNRYIPQSDREK